MPANIKNTNDFLPLTPVDFQVLTILAERPLHGYGIVQAAEDEYRNQPQLEIGSLYRIVSRMLDHGLITEVGPPTAGHTDRRKRRFYEATALGIAVARAEVRRMQALVSSAAAVRLLEAEG